ncbi:MAG: glycoside hydrolase family 2 protein, partial [Bacillota bacterium]
MNRLFKRHYKRETRLLDGVWKFKIDPENKGLKEKWFQGLPDDCDDIVVPSCWNNEMGLYHYEGKAWYETSFETKSKNISLAFHGFTGQIEIYLDGKKYDSHYGGFSGYNCLIKDIETGEHKLIVLLENTHDEINTIPLSRVDWFHYGGLFRSVELMELGDVWIKDYRIDYNLNESLTKATLDFYIELESFNSDIVKRRLGILINNEEIYSKEVEIKGETVINIENLAKEDIKLWDIGQGNLYKVHMQVEDDDIVEKIGFRKIEIKDKNLLLNGKAVELKGVNRHEDHPDWGFALPFKIMKKDMDIIKEMGCNAIRGSHYPNAEIFLDYCDQKGILFWEEIPMWGFPEKALENPLVLERGLDMHEKMLRRDCHHPSIIIWGMHNEIDTRTEAGYKLSKAFVEKVRELDDSRPLTYATMHPLEDICYELVDIVSVNKYYGWYEKMEGWEYLLRDLKTKLIEEDLEDMPIIMSEFGAGAIYGESTFEAPKWTETYQRDYLDYTLKLFKNDPDIIGTYIWQYCDIRTAAELEMG